MNSARSRKRMDCWMGPIHRAVVALCLAGAFPAQGFCADQAWRLVGDSEGIRTETRAVAGERFDELRVTTVVRVPPQTVADYLFGKYLDEKNRNISRVFVRRGKDLTIWSDVLDTPMISERCYSMRFERETRGNGEIRVRFASLEYLGAKPKPDCVALRSRGEWVMTPLGKGTRLSYSSLTDVGGRVPVPLVRRSLSAAAVMSVRKVTAGASGQALPRGIGD
ncbi:MAG: hypothetical protein ABWY31_06885 [Pseudoxanthomonas sp.]